jgi:hypothetical protein
MIRLLSVCDTATPFPIFKDPLFPTIPDQIEDRRDERGCNSSA